MRKKIYRLGSLDKETGEPQIGIFWVYRGQVFQFTQPYSSVPPVGGFRDSNYTHDGYWGQMEKMFPELAGKEYFSVPRGRVLFEVNGTFHIVMSSKDAKNQILIARIKRAFNLPPKTVVDTDVHYNPPEELGEDFD